MVKTTWKSDYSGSAISCVIVYNLAIWDPYWFQIKHGDLGSVYAGSDPFGTGTKLVRINLVFTRDLVDPVRIGSAIWYQMGLLMKVILCGTEPFQFRTGPRV